MSQSQAVTKTVRLFSTSRIVSVFVAALCIAATSAHIYLGAGAEYATGPLAILDHSFDLVAAVAISFLILSVGHSLTKRISLQFVNSAEQLAFSFLLGTGVVGLLVLFVGLLGALSGWVMLALLTLAIVFTQRDLPQLWQALNRATHTAFSTPEAKLAGSLFIAFLAFVILRTLAPPHIADELIYHLPVPRQFVMQRRVFPSYDNSLGNMPFLLHMIYTLFLTAGSDVAAKLFSLFLAIASAVSLYAFCSRYLTRRAGVIALIAFFASGMIVELAVTTRIDVSLAGMLFACTYAMINYLTTRNRNWLWLSALFAGFSLGIKHTAALWIFLVGILYLVETVKSRESIPKVLRSGVIYSFIALAMASPWYLKNAIWFHNPVYPFVTGEVATFGADGVRYFNADDEQKLDAHFAFAGQERPDMVAALEQELGENASSRVSRHPLRWWEFFFKPNTYLMAEPNQLPNYLFLIVPLVVLTRPTKWIWWLLVLAVAFVFIVTLTSWIARYLVPAYPALTIVAAYTLARLSEQLKSRFSLAKILPLYVLAILFAIVGAACAASIRQFKTLQYVSGSISRHDFLAPIPFYGPLDFINTQLPQRTRVLTIGAQMTYGLERPYYADESWFATKWRRLLVRNDSLEDVNQELKAKGFTHILYDPSLFMFAARMGLEGTGGMSLLAKSENGAAAKSPEYPLLRNWATFTLYKERFLEPVYTDEYGYEVLRIK